MTRTRKDAPEPDGSGALWRGAARQPACCEIMDRMTDTVTMISTKAMRGWAVEPRHESFYLHDPGRGYGEDASMRFTRAGDDLMLAAADLGAVSVSLARASRWVERHEPTIGDGREVYARLVRGRVAFSGLDFELSYTEVWCGRIEIRYAELPGLRSQLAGIAAQIARAAARLGTTKGARPPKRAGVVALT